jgi:tetratricopeptide (TPR) repeat protein
MSWDRASEAVEQFERGLAVARARGDRPWERALLAGFAAALFWLGRWDEAAEICVPLSEQASDDVSIAADVFPLVARLYAARGDIDALDTIAGAAGGAESADAQLRWTFLEGQAAVAQAHGRAEEALEISRGLLKGAGPETRAKAYSAALEAAWAMDDQAEVEMVVDTIGQLPPVDATPMLRAQSARFAGLLAAKRGDADAAGERLDAAIVMLRELGYRFEVAKVLLDRGEVLQDAGRVDEAEPFIAEAHTTFAELGARPLLERAQRAQAGRPASAA